MKIPVRASMASNPCLTNLDELIDSGFMPEELIEAF